MPEYWIVDPVAQTVEIYELGADGYELRLNASGSQTISSSTLPGLTFPAKSLFPER